MTRIVLLVVFFFASLFYSCRSTSKVPYSQVIVTRLDSSSSLPMVSIWYPFLFFANEYHVKKDSSLLLKIPTPTAGVNFSIRIEDKDTSIMIYMPDSININIVNSGIEFVFKRSENLKYNLYEDGLRRYRYLHFDWLPAYSEFKDKNDVINYNRIKDSLLKMQRNREMDVALTLLDKYQISGKMRNELLRDIDVLYLIRNNKWSTYNENVLDSLQLLIPQVHRFISATEALSKEEFLKSSVAFDITNIYNYFPEKPSAVVDRQTLINRYQIIDKYFRKNSIPRQFLISALAVTASKRRISQSGYKLVRFRKESKKSVFNEYIVAQTESNILHEQYNSSTENKHSDGNIYDSNLKSIQMSALFAKYAGQPLLIDFWASWCLPCILNLPEIMSYQTKFPSLNIVFLSLDKDHYQWNRELKKRGLLQFNNYRRNYNNQDSITKSIETIPRYGLLMNDGSVKVLDKIDEIAVRSYLSYF